MKENKLVKIFLKWPFSAKFFIFFFFIIFIFLNIFYLVILLLQVLVAALRLFSL